MGRLLTEVSGVPGVLVGGSRFQCLGLVGLPLAALGGKPQANLEYLYLEEGEAY